MFISSFRFLVKLLGTYIRITLFYYISLLVRTRWRACTQRQVFVSGFLLFLCLSLSLSIIWSSFFCITMAIAMWWERFLHATLPVLDEAEIPKFMLNAHQPCAVSYFIFIEIIKQTQMHGVIWAQPVNCFIRDCLLLFFEQKKKQFSRIFLMIIFLLFKKQA